MLIIIIIFNTILIFITIFQIELYFIEGNNFIVIKNNKTTTFVPQILLVFNSN